jgi:hypothetical protein
MPATFPEYPLTHTTFWDWNILYLDVEVWTFIDNDTSFASFRDVKSLDLVFRHVEIYV